MTAFLTSHFKGVNLVSREIGTAGAGDFGRITIAVMVI